MDLALLFFLPLIGGFRFVESFSLTRFRAARQETQRLYYKAALCGAVLTLVGLLLHLILIKYVGAYLSFVNDMRESLVTPLLDRPTTTGAAPVPGTVPPGSPPPVWVARTHVVFACIWALLLGICTPLYNAVIAIVDQLHYALYARRRGQPPFLERLNVRSITDQFELLLAKAVWEKSLIQVTLTNQKMYVGSVTRSVDPRSQEKYIRLLPYMSGFRSKDTGEVTYTTFYADLLERKDPVELASYEIVVPMDKVTTASGFDLQAYVAFSEARSREPHAPPRPTEVVVTFGRPLRAPDPQNR